MIFPSTVNGIPCQIKVTYAKAEVPAQIWGPPEECSPSEPAEFEFDVLDQRGRPAKWLERYLDEKTVERIQEEYRIMLEGECYEPS